MAKYLCSYLPSSIVSYVADNGINPGTEPLCQTYETVVIFADVSGYTAMCEAIAAMGVGAEEHLARNLNSYFEMLLKAMSSSGGDVFKFAGDAILVVWPPSDEDLPTKVRRAIQCGMNISSSFQDAQLSHGVRLSVKIGIGAGNISILHLGGLYNRLEYLAVGDPLVQAFGAEGHATKTELIVSPFAWGMVKDHFEAIDADGYAIITGKKGSGLRAVSIAKQASSLLEAGGFELAKRKVSSYIPSAIVPFATLNDDKWINEIRSITVLFVNLGVGEDDLVNMKTPKDFMRIHTILRSVQVAVYEFEGSLNKFLMDDKGSTLLAAFGLPPLAHENDPLRGVLCATKIINSLKELNLRASVGITTGTAFCGVVGGRGRREYSVLGDSVNLAARLMQHAKTTGAGVIIDTPTCEACRRTASLHHQLFFTDIAEITVKGKAKPLVIWQPIFKKPVSYREALMNERTREAVLGDGTEAEKLRELVENDVIMKTRKREIEERILGEEGKDSAQGPLCILLEALPGLGKATLMAAVVAELEDKVHAVFAGGDPIRCKKGHLWKQVIGQLFEDCAVDYPRVWIREELARRNVSDKFVACVDAVLGLDFEGEEEMKDMTMEEKLEQATIVLRCTMEGLVAKLHEITNGKRIVIFIADGEAMDAFSWAFAAEVADSVNVAMVLATRPMDTTYIGAFVKEVARGYYRIKQNNKTHLVTLEPRSEKIIVELAQRVLGVEGARYNLPQALTKLLQKKTNGNPMASILLVQHFKDEGLISVDGQQKVHIKNTLCPMAHEAEAKRLTDPKSLAMPLPVVLSALVGSRMDRMTLHQQMLLKVASLLGDRFSFTLLKKIFPLKCEQEELDKAVEGLRELNVLSNVDDDLLEFNDGLMRDMLLSRLLVSHQTVLLNKLKMNSAEYQADPTADLAEDGGEKKFPESVMEGWLQKEGNSFVNKWKKKYVVLTAAKLFYFDQGAKDFTSSKSEIMMSLNTVVERGEHPNHFAVNIGEARKMTFEAVNREETEKWISRIKMIIDEKKKEARDNHGRQSNGESHDKLMMMRTNNMTHDSDIKLKGSQKAIRYSKIYMELERTSLLPKIYEESKMEGFLMKRKDSVKMWRKRYFILMNGKLSYYTDNHSIKKVKGEINLSPKTIVELEHVDTKQKEEEEEKTFTIQSNASARKYYFTAKNPTECAAWMKFIKEMSMESEAETIKKMANHSVKEGFLRKQGGTLGNWRKRYFVLFTNKLHYYTETREQKTGEMQLFRESKVQADPANPLHFHILPNAGAKKYTLEAVNAADCESWVSTIQAQLLIAPMQAATASRRKSDAS